MRRTTAPTPPSARRSPRWPLSRGLSVPGPWAFRPRSVGFPSPVRGLFVPGLWAFRPRSVFSLLTGGRFSAFCAFWRPRSLTKLRTGDTSPSDPGRFTFGPATLPFRPALNPVLPRIVVKIRLCPALNPVLRCIVVKIRLRPALNPVLHRIVVKSRLRPALSQVLRCIVVKIRLRPALNPVLRRIMVKSRLWPALNPVLRRIVVKSRLWPGLNPVLRCIVVKSRSDRCTYGVCAPCGRRRRGRDGRKKSGRRLVTLGRWWAVLDSNQ